MATTEATLHPAMRQPPRQWGPARFGGLAGFQKKERDAMVTDNLRQVFGVDDLGASFFQLVRIAGIFKTESAQSQVFTIDAMTVEMHHVIGRIFPAAPAAILRTGQEKLAATAWSVQSSPPAFPAPKPMAGR